MSTPSLLDAPLQDQLKGYLERLQHPVYLRASLDDSQAAVHMRQLLHEIAALSAQVRIAFDGQHSRRPSFCVSADAASERVRFAGVPLGQEFTSLVLALLWAGGHPPKEDAETLAQIRAIWREQEFEVFMSLSCHNCPDVVQATVLMATMNPHIRTTVIDGALFQEEVQARQVMAVPVTFCNGQQFAVGRQSIEAMLLKIDAGTAARVADRLTARAPFDVLVIGAGPAGAAAAVYAARKGVRVGMLAERLGGQVNDTLAIENYISVLATAGPQFAQALETQVRHYDVDVMVPHNVHQIDAAASPGGLIQVTTESGAILRAHCVIVATGARWRNLHVPGEQAYRNQGVAYCPHCDGPLFKGKRVAVVGGGNSGVEAALDLAGIVQHVTLIEFDAELRADAVLTNKLKSLANVSILLHAQTTEVLGDGQRVNGLRYTDRGDGSVRTIALEGVFVQIGLVPNTEWLRQTLACTPSGEVRVDAKCRTNVAGVFAAGDCTTAPYKQIVIAAGEGAKAALSAFEYLMRRPVATTSASQEA